IGLYADCGRFGDERVEGDAQVAFTIFVEAISSAQTAVQVNTRMRTDTYTRGSGPPKPRSGLPCASTGRWEANLLDTVRALLRPCRGARASRGRATRGRRAAGLSRAGSTPSAAAGPAARATLGGRGGARARRAASATARPRGRGSPDRAGRASAGG